MILKVKQNENPYDVIGNYIEKHIPVIDDIIAVISINGEIRNELFLVDGEIDSTNNFVWQIDWWEGEENVELIDFFFVSDACKNNNNNDLISREQAIDALGELPTFTEDWSDNTWMYTDDVYNAIKQLPPIQPELHIGHWKPVGVAEVVGGESAMWGSAIAYHVCSECWEQALEENGEEKLSDFCPHCGADMRGEQDG